MDTGRPVPQASSVRARIVVTALAGWIAFPILTGFTGRAEQDETIYLEPLVRWFQDGVAANAYAAGLQAGVTTLSVLQPPGWLYFLAPFYALFGFGYHTVRIALLVEMIAFGWLLVFVGKRAGAGVAILAACLIVSLATPALLVEPGRMDLLAGLLVSGVFVVLRYSPPKVRYLAGGTLLGLAGLVHPLPAVAAAIAIPVVLWGEPHIMRRALQIGGAAVITVILLWVPFLWGHFDLLGSQFAAHGERHFILFGGFAKVSALARSNPIVMFATALTLLRVVLTPHKRRLFSDADFRGFAIPQALAVGAVLAGTISYYYYFNWLLPLSAIVVVVHARDTLGTLSTRHARLTSAAILVFAILFARGRVAYDQLLPLFNRGNSPEAQISAVVERTVRGGLVVTDPTAYYSARPLAADLRELETFAGSQPPAAYAGVDYLVLLERRGDLFFRIQDSTARAFIREHFRTAADVQIRVRTFSPRGAGSGTPAIPLTVGRLAVLRRCESACTVAP